MPQEDFSELELSAVVRGVSFSSYSRRDFSRSPHLIEVLQAYAKETEELAIANGRAAARYRKECESLRDKASTNQLQDEREQGDLRTELRALETMNLALEERLALAERQSAVAVFVAWIGTLLVAIGVNLATGNSNQSVGIVVILAGALTGASAFFVRGRLKPMQKDAARAGQITRT